MMHLDFSFLTWSVAKDLMFKGLTYSVELTVVPMAAGIVLGTALALMRLSGKPWLAAPARAYVNLLRSIPLVMVILWFFLLIPLIIGRPVGAEASALVTFSVFEAAYYAEIMRAGIGSVAPGQTSAGYALGMNYRQVMAHVVLPQAFRNMIPLLLTQTIVLFQDTSLVYAIGAFDLLKGFEITGVNYNHPVEAYLLAAITYFAISYTLSSAVKRYHNAIRIHR